MKHNHLIMSFLPKIKRCPSCDSFNIIRINGISYDNHFKSLTEWTLKKIFNCKKCKVELGLFLHNFYQKEKLIWVDLLKCEDQFHNTLVKLQAEKIKNKKLNKKYYKILNEIKDIQNEIRLNQTKLKIKCKIKNRGLLIRHVY